MRRSFTRMAVTGVAAATLLVATATPAMADSDIILKFNHGYFLYHDNGDMFEVCDTKADGHGVVGRLMENNDNSPVPGFGEILRVDDGGDAGCDKKGHDVQKSPSYTYQMRLHWNGGGGTIVSKSFRE
ncbi:hypothetical protein ACQPZG_12860 [Streptomyces sp. CA-294286]|uniref:hypothetical protein n=1 Tax=Streptomyces sp. CA-294286 TaxID=3240070 RepID=UPI003D91366C